jgi:hypothetical protein
MRNKDKVISFVLSFFLIAFISMRCYSAIFMIASSAFAILASVAFFAIAFIVNTRFNIFDSILKWICECNGIKHHHTFAAVIFIPALIGSKFGYTLDILIAAPSKPLSPLLKIITGTGFNFSVFISFFAMAALIVPYVKAISLSKVKKVLLHPILAWALFLAIAGIYVLLSNPIYTFDNTVYWNQANQILDMLSNHSLFETAKIIYGTVNSDYNFFPAIFIAPFMALFGASRIVYIFAISFYFLGCCITLYHLVTKISSKPALVFYIILLQVPLFGFLLRDGMLDFGSGIFTFSALSIIISILLEGNKKPSSYFALGILCTLAFVYRRYMLVFLITITILIITYFLYLIYKLLKNKQDIGNVLQCFFSYISGIFIISFLFFQNFIINQVFIRSYSTMYQYYNYGLAHSISIILSIVGCLASTLLILGFIYLLILKYKSPEPVTVKHATFSMVGLLLSIFIFLTQQSMSSHQMMVVVPYIVLLLAITNDMLIRSKKTKIILIALSILSFSTSFMPNLQSHIAGQSKFVIERRSTDDINVLGKLTDKLLSITNEKDQVYINGCSSEFNIETIQNYYLSVHGVYKLPSIQPCSIVDGRDPTPVQIFDASYVVVTDPVQYERGPEYQRVIQVLGEMFLTNKGIAPAFSLIGTYQLSSDIKIYLYKRDRDLTNPEKATLLDTLHNYYPQNTLYPTSAEYFSSLKK